MSIPNWNACGVLPPIDMVAPVSDARSPYQASLDDVILRFGTATQRREILAGWLSYRKSLHAAGLVSGFQWLDGSFLEDVEMTESRPPNDIDCVTFYRLPVGTSERELVQSNPELFITNQVKAKFKVDGYTANLALPSHLLVKRSCYWYSVWSHRRDLSWKGFVEVDLEPTNDGSALKLLASLSTEQE